jgi:plastocyanin
MSKIIIAIAVAGLVAVVGFVVFRGIGEAPTEEVGSVAAERVGVGTVDGIALEGSSVEGATVTALPLDGEVRTHREFFVTYTGEGYSPETVNVSVGDTVVFISQGSKGTWPASAMHPTHTVYPGSDIKKCFDGSDTSGLFDSCGEIAPGESWSFTFNEAGEWAYHDHKSSDKRGVVVVE